LIAVLACLDHPESDKSIGFPFHFLLDATDPTSDEDIGIIKNEMTWSVLRTLYQVDQ